MFNRDKLLLIREMKRVELPNMKADLLNYKRNLIKDHLHKNNFKRIVTNPEELAPMPICKPKIRINKSKSLPRLPKSIPKKPLKTNTLKTEANINASHSIVTLSTCVT